MFLDEDITPYYDFSGEPEISVFGDTDTNPYYEDGGNLDGEDPVYLDSSDDNPYVQEIMTLNNIQSVGNDQQWKAEVERAIKDLQNQVVILTAQVNSRGV